MPPFFVVLLFWVFVFGGGFYLAVRFLRAFEQRGPRKGELEDLRGRVRMLEEALDVMGGEVHRLSEAQTFTTQLLEGRSTSAGIEPPAPGPSDQPGREP